MASLLRPLGALASTASLAAFLVVGSAPVAHAVTNCEAEHEVDTNIFWDDHRVKAICYRLDSGRKARGVLQVRLDRDRHTVWFTGLNIARYSNWTTLVPGEYQGVDMRYGDI